jgi:hypothetical protein
VVARHVAAARQGRARLTPTWTMTCRFEGAIAT